MRRIVGPIVVVVCILNQLNARSPSPLRFRRNAYKSEEWRWPNGVVPYVISSEFDVYDTKIIRYAMKNIEEVSCIRFKNRTDERTYVWVWKGRLCSADVGYAYGIRYLSLGPGCVAENTVMHELFHVLGFFHEHTRTDRDQHVVVLKKNIIPEKLHNFEIKDPEEVTNLSMPYDYNSIVHYRDNTFTVDDDLKSLKSTTDTKLKSKSARWMSIPDILKLNYLYKCPKNEKKTFVKMLRQRGQRPF